VAEIAPRLWFGLLSKPKPPSVDQIIIADNHENSPATSNWRQQLQPTTATCN